ncbi:MAG: hypothetical protein JW732_05900 [Dehalococcoidia bacterium]|nr:hypothetical protein [Dehalococcoidia bacterium]
MYYYDNATDFGLEPGPDAANLYDVLIPGSEHERGRTGRTSEARPSGIEEVVSAKSIDLITALQAGDLDYAYEYRSVAVQNELNYIELDDHINLSKTSAELPGVEEFYSEASIEIIRRLALRQLMQPNMEEPSCMASPYPCMLRIRSLLQNSLIPSF